MGRMKDWMMDMEEQVDSALVPATMTGLGIRELGF